MGKFLASFLLIPTTLFFWSVKAGEEHLLYIHNVVQIVSPKNTPPYFAYYEIQEFGKKKSDPFEAAKQQVNLRAGETLTSHSMNIPTIELAALFVEAKKTNSNSLKMVLNNEINPSKVAQSSKNENLSLASLNPLQSGYQRIVGPVEICCGLALTNEHKFIVRRVKEGISQELGVISHSKGEFTIDVAELSGELEAILYDSDGQIIGVGSYRITDYFPKSLNVTAPENGPVLRVSPPRGLFGSFSSLLGDQNRINRQSKFKKKKNQ